MLQSSLHHLSLAPLSHWLVGPYYPQTFFCCQHSQKRPFLLSVARMQILCYFQVQLSFGFTDFISECTGNVFAFLLDSLPCFHLLRAPFLCLSSIRSSVFILALCQPAWLYTHWDRSFKCSENVASEDESDHPRHFPSGVVSYRNLQVSPWTCQIYSSEVLDRDYSPQGLKLHTLDCTRIIFTAANNAALHTIQQFFSIYESQVKDSIFPYLCTWTKILPSEHSRSLLDWLCPAMLSFQQSDWGPDKN